MKRIRKVSTLVGLCALGALAMNGCDQANKIKEAQSGLCCSDFVVGADMSGVDFGADAKFNAFVQATGDFSGTAAVIVDDLTNACRSIAVDMGEPENSVTAADQGDRLKQWCAAAAAKIKAEAGGSITIKYQPPVCTFSASAQAKCEGGCTADVSCEAELGDVSARCDPGKLSVSCEGSCTGSCEGSANLAVTCDGTCSGTCEGTCNGTCSAQGGNGDCKGQCDGTCSGECRGSCKATAAAGASCEGKCTGGCTGTATAPKCTAELTPPSAKCQGDVDCSASCKASASAKAECKEPSVEITAAGTISASAEASLKANLPKIVLILKGRLDGLAANAKVVGEVGASIDPGSLDVKAAACLVPVIAAIGEAAANIDASVAASASLSGSITF